MKFAKSRVCGIILLILSLTILTAGILGNIADREGTPLNAAYSRAQADIAEQEQLTAAIAAAQDALARAEKRSSEALSEANDALTAAEKAQSDAENPEFDPDTDVGALGQSIADAQSGGADLSSVLEAYAVVANADLAAQLDTVKTDVSRAENALDDAVAALQKVSNLFTEAAEVAPVEHATVPKLGDLAGLTRMVTRAKNYVTRSQAAADNAALIREIGDSLLESASALTLKEQSGSQKLTLFARNRSVDLIVVGSILLIAALTLLFAPAWLAKKWKVRVFRNGLIFAVAVLLLAAALYYAKGDTWDLMRQGVFDTLYMTIPSTFFAYVLGLPLGVLLVITSPGHIRENNSVNSVVGTIVNFLRSIPFIILLVMLFDVTRLVMGSAIGTRAVIFPLFVSAFPYVARIVEGSLAEVDRGVIEAAESMGSTTWQIIYKVLIPEAMPSLINGAALCMTTILAYTAMAGSAGGDGLGKIAITYGLNYREYDIMYISSLLLVALVQIIQIAGGILTRAADHRKR